MILEQYQEIKFRKDTLGLIALANQIIENYQAQGLDLTLRQLYYRLVAADVIPNKQTEYDRLGRIISDARLAGLVAWDAIVDRTRNMKANPHWGTPGEIMQAAASGYARDKWADQIYRPVVLVEKEALEGVVAQIGDQLDVPYEACKGYFSQSEMWGLAKRCLRWMKKSRGAHTNPRGQHPIILHLGDHDPSGIDMTRDIQDRLEMFCGCPIVVRRLALNMPQIEQYDPPPNPAKQTDSRFSDYADKFGDESWELDALEPDVLMELISDAVSEYRDDEKWERAVRREARERKVLEAAAGNWNRVEQLFASSLEE